MRWLCLCVCQSDREGGIREEEYPPLVPPGFMHSCMCCAVSMHAHMWMWLCTSLCLLHGNQQSHHDPWDPITVKSVGLPSVCVGLLSNSSPALEWWVNILNLLRGSSIEMSKFQFFFYISYCTHIRIRMHACEISKYWGRSLMINNSTSLDIKCVIDCKKTHQCTEPHIETTLQIPFGQCTCGHHQFRYSETKKSGRLQWSNGTV